jgi:chromosome segregation ATPase
MSKVISFEWLREIADGPICAEKAYATIVLEALAVLEGRAENAEGTSEILSQHLAATAQKLNELEGRLAEAEAERAAEASLSMKQAVKLGEAKLRAEKAEGRLAEAALRDDRLLNVLRETERRLAEATEALREAKLHQGLPEDAPPERVAAHFRNNREMREGFEELRAEPATATPSFNDTLTDPPEPTPSFDATLAPDFGEGDDA